MPASSALSLSWVRLTPTPVPLSHIIPRHLSIRCRQSNSQARRAFCTRHFSSPSGRLLLLPSPPLLLLLLDVSSGSTPCRRIRRCPSHLGLEAERHPALTSLPHALPSILPVSTRRDCTGAHVPLCGAPGAHAPRSGRGQRRCGTAAAAAAAFLLLLCTAAAAAAPVHDLLAASNNSN